MNTDFLKNTSNFTEDGKGNFYKKADGFLYTVTPADEGLFLYVNLPELNGEQKKSFTAYLKENISLLSKVRIVKNGIKITLEPDITEDDILNIIAQTSLFLTEQGIEFPKNHYDVVLKNHMYVFEEGEEKNFNEEPLFVEEVQNDEVSLEGYQEELPAKKSGFISNFCTIIDKIPTQILLIIVYLICSLAFILLSLINISLAAATGYLMGWLATAVLVRRGHQNKKIFISVTVASFIALLLAGIYSFLYLFLTQQDIYTVYEFFVQSLSPSYCGFNILLAFLLSMFGTYSTLPAKKKAQKFEEDFN